MAPPYIGVFAHALRMQESDDNYRVYNPSSGAAGAYQFLFTTWRYALRLASFQNTTWYDMSPNGAPDYVQDIAAESLIEHYYYAFGRSYYHVAEAWYGGPGAVGHPNISGGPGYPTVGQYAAAVLWWFRKLGGPGSLTKGPPPLGTPPVRPRLTAANHRELQIYASAVTELTRGIAGDIRAIRAAGGYGKGPIVRQHR